MKLLRGLQHQVAVKNPCGASVSNICQETTGRESRGNTVQISSHILKYPGALPAPRSTADLLTCPPVPLSPWRTWMVPKRWTNGPQMVGADTRTMRIVGCINQCVLCCCESCHQPAQSSLVPSEHNSWAVPDSSYNLVFLLPKIPQRMIYLLC